MAIDIESATGVLRRFYRTYHRLPSYQEMCALFGFASKRSSFLLVEKLVAAHILTKDEHGKLAPKKLFATLPLYGSIKAGLPAPAEEQDFSFVSFDEYLVQDPTRSFVLKVSGDSMIEAGIYEGDLVIIEKNVSFTTGDVVVALIDSQWTLKYYKQQNGQVYLESANPKYPPLYPRDNLEIWGKVVSVVRRYN